MTLTQQLSSEPGLASVEGGTLFSGPDPTISKEAPALATPEKTDAEYEKSMGVEAATAKRKARSGWDDDKAKSKGWRVDGLDSDTSPFYVSDEVYGNHGSDKKAAKLRDTPGDWTTDTNMGKEFRTCAVSYKDGKGTVLACVDWGYFIDDKGAASFYPAKPTATTGAVQELLDAATRWDGIAGNTKANL